ncbi:caspase, EACC1-associated type [Chamaesiphon sp. VAR_48_metabat_135_sub]|uniref:caspase, EACC1-associated type n=1 Tax=Chamaesiphon sp. VAR_48_metabat_135_sub TaxID=2964699 RepID=UPI00286C6743|nr:S-layer homology domain-containing protein [Chamaesiphon sp. VAR_48_metabat_135_sub]
MTKVALLIGVSEYESGLSPLPSAVADVDALYRVLIDPERGNFLAENIKVLKNPDRQEMENEIFWLFNARQKDDLLLFYFSGHGIKDDRNNNLYLSTRITRLDGASLVHPSAVAATYLQDSLKFSRSERQVIILDACYSGAIAQGMTVKDDGTVRLDDYLGGKGRAILTSSTATEKSFGADSTEHGSSGLSTYTRYLVEGIATGAADLDEDDWISVDELHEYASKKVKKESPAMTPKFYPVEEGFKIRLSKSRGDGPKLKYEREVQKRAEEGNGEFSIFVERMLLGKQQEWGIEPEEAKEIEDRVLQPYREYRQKLREYEQTIKNAVQNNYPFSDREQADFDEYQQQLKLRDEDVAEIHQRVKYISSELLITPVNNPPIEQSPESLTPRLPVELLIARVINFQRDSVAYASFTLLRLLVPLFLFVVEIPKRNYVIGAGIASLLLVIIQSNSNQITVKPNRTETPALKQITQSTDIAGNWAEPFIKSLVEKDIIKGYPDGSFKPDQPITRAEFAALLNRAFDLQPLRAGRKFKDIPEKYWAEEVIQKAYQSGFVSGYPNGTFAPNQNTLRIQSLVSLANGTKIEPSSTLDLNNVFYDAAQVPSYGQNALVAATQRCMAVSAEYNSSQLPGGNFGPNTVATRSDVAAYVHQTLVAAGKLTALDKYSSGNKYIASCPQGVYTTSISSNNTNNVPVAKSQLYPEP